MCGTFSGHLQRVQLAISSHKGHSHLLRRDCEGNAVNVSGAEVDKAVRDGNGARVCIDDTLVVKLLTHTGPTQSPCKTISKQQQVTVAMSSGHEMMEARIRATPSANNTC